MFPLLIALASLVAAPKPEASIEDSTAAHGRAEAFYHYSLGVQARMAGDGETALAELRRAQKLDPQSASIRAATARLLSDLGKGAEALTEAREAVALDPKNVEAHMILGRIYQGFRDDGASLKLAAAAYQTVASLDPTEVDALLLLASIYAELDDHKGAAEAWQRYASAVSSPEAFVKAGSHFLAAGIHDSAATALQKAVEMQPNSGRAYQALGEVYDRAGEADSAVLYYRKALELEPSNLRVQLTLGDVLMRSKRLSEAKDVARGVLEADPENRLALELMAQVLREQKDFDAAMATANQILTLAPRDVKAVYLKVTIAEARRDYSDAVSILEAVLARPKGGEDPKQAAINDRIFFVHLGVAYRRLNRPEEAAKTFARALALGGVPDADVMAYEVEALLEAKQPDKALRTARVARQAFADDAELAVLEATALRATGDPRAAKDRIETLLRKSPKDVQVLLRVADYHQNEKQYVEAEQALGLAKEVAPRDVRVLFQLGAIFERQKKTTEAEKMFRAALEIEPDSAPVLNYLGYMNAERGLDLLASLELIEKALELDPENGAYLDSLGWVQFRLHRLDQAEETLRRAIAKEGENAVILDHLGDALKAKGQVSEALKMWTRALSADDPGGELDRERVQRKIVEAQSMLEAQGHRP